MKTIILGAGITGLSAGISTGGDVYEASDRPGGICRSYYKDGYRFENGGGHWIFKANKVGDFLAKYADYNRFNRNASVYFNQLVACPSQRTLSYAESAQRNSFKYWLSQNFSTEMCNLFFYPFNNKYTCGYYNDVVQDDPAKTPEPKDPDPVYNDDFYYPNGVGLDSVVDRMAINVNIKYNKTAVKVSIDKNEVEFSDGEKVHYDKLINTTPLDMFLRMTREFLPVTLKRTSVMVVNIGAEYGYATPKEQWIYVPNMEQDFFRVGFYSNVDPSFAPKGKVSMYIERAVRSKLSDLDMNEYRSKAISTLQRWGWIGKVNVIEDNFIPCAYTWMTNHTTREEQLAFLRKNNIHSIGRYGKWKFQGIAESIFDGLNV